MPQTSDPDLLAAALIGYQEILKQIESQIAELRRRLNVAPAAAAVPAPKKRRISATGRANIVAALKKRWAAVKRAKRAASQAAAPKAAPKKRKLSTAGRANIVAALRKRWAAVKRAKKAATKLAAPKPVPKKAPAATPKRAARKITRKAAVKRRAPRKVQPAPVVQEPTVPNAQTTTA
jgi:hypothetical protein